MAFFDFPHWQLKLTSSERGVVAPDERLPLAQTAVMGVQHAVAMFGATMLMPILMGLDPNLSILMSGIGTLLFFFITGGRVPSYLGSSAAFVGVVIAATGLRPEIALAQRAGAETNRGVKVDSYLQTTQPDIYALGDCAEINGQVLPFLQPIQLSAMYLAKNLLGASVPLKLPAMLVKVKTPELPLHLAGETQRQDLNWQIAIEPQGMVAKGADSDGNLRAFVVSEDRMKEAFALLKALPV
ncbi:MAG: solute carrier family 23 protein [Leclercia sp.]